MPTIAELTIGRRTLLAGLVAAAVLPRAALAANRPIPGWYADPEIRIFGNRYWIYRAEVADEAVSVSPLARGYGWRQRYPCTATIADTTVWISCWRSCTGRAVSPIITATA